MRYFFTTIAIGCSVQDLYLSVSQSQLGLISGFLHCSWLLWFAPKAAFAEATEQDQQAVVGGNTEFALDLYARLRGEDGNLFLSPYSISTALAMTYAGARGETARQMEEVLHFTLPPEQLHAAYAAMLAADRSARGPMRWT